MEQKNTKEEAENKTRKKVTLEDIVGMVNGLKTDAVELKKRVRRGEKF